MVLNLQVMALAGIVVGVHSLRDRIGLGATFLVVGLLVAFLDVGTRLSLTAPALGGSVGFYPSLVYLPVLLATIGLVYTLDGTEDAQRLLAAIGIGGAVVAAIVVLLGQHLTLGGLDAAIHGRDRWAGADLWRIVASTMALLVDGVVIIVVYQALVGRAPWMPVFLALGLAVCAAAVVDGALYPILSGRARLPDLYADLLGKAIASGFCALTIGAYAQAQLRRADPTVRAQLRARRALEVVTLRSELARLDAAVKRTREVMQRYVVAEAVDEILDDPDGLALGGEKRHVTVLFSDIRGYSTFAERMAPEKVIELLNQYFGAMGKIIDAERGAIIEYEGDGILAVFGAPLKVPDHAARAVAAAQAMLDEVMRLDRAWKADGTAKNWIDAGIPSFRIRIGIHTGDVVAGNLGSARRVKYAIIGDAVNVAARVEALNKECGTVVLLTRSTAEAIGDAFALRPLGAHAVKGRREPLEVYTLAEVAPMEDPFASYDPATHRVR